MNKQESDMTQQEFEKQTSQRLSAEEYAAVERDYMGLPDEPDIFKDQFCGLWIAAGCKKTDRSVADFLLTTFYDETKSLQKEVEFYKDLFWGAHAEIKALQGGAA
jgi:hypothetical protein